MKIHRIQHIGPLTNVWADPARLYDLACLLLERSDGAARILQADGQDYIGITLPGHHPVARERLIRTAANNLF